MRTVIIPKGNGKTRTIHVPDKGEMARLRALVPELTKRMVEADKCGVMHGFFSGRSCVTNAMQHVGFRFTLKFDLKDFFDTVTSTMVEGSKDCFIFPPLPPLPLLEPGQWVFYTKTNGKAQEGRVKQRHPVRDAYWVVYRCNLDWDHYYNYTGALTMAEDLRLTKEEPNQVGYAGQGLPTSPILANIAAAKMDEDICKLSRRQGRFDNRFRYTRYADDLTFSFNDLRVASILKAEVPRLVREHGFVLNEKKTRLQNAAFGRRVVTGVAVGDDGVYPRRSVKRRLRAARRHGNNPQASGLEEYLKLKVPKKWKDPDRGVVQTVVNAVAHVFHSVTGTAEQAPRQGVTRRFKL